MSFILSDGIMRISLGSRPCERGSFGLRLEHRHGNEIDDGFNVTTSVNADAKIGEWVNGEPVLGQDVVLCMALTSHMTLHTRAPLSTDISLDRTWCR
jgi:hypothetical protein